MPLSVRRVVGCVDAEVAPFSAGAALVTFDPILRSEDPVGILWVKRLALPFAESISQLAGRREGKAELRDVFALRKPSDDSSVVGRMLIG